MESFRHSCQNEWKLAWRESLRNSFRSITPWNHSGSPCKINGNWFGELLVNFLMDSLRKSFQNQWKLIWRAPGQYPNGILKEFLAKSTEMGLERILKEFYSTSMEIGLESSWSISQWNPYGIPFKSNGQLPNGILKEFRWKSMKIDLEKSWSIHSPSGRLPHGIL